MSEYRRPQYLSRKSPEERAKGGPLLGGHGGKGMGAPMGDKRAERAATTAMMDSDKDGRLSQEERKAAFKRFDKDGNGRLDRREVNDVLREEGLNPNPGMVGDIYRKLRGLGRSD